MEFLISGLAVFVLTLMLVENSGPFGVFTRLRNQRGFEALECMFCTSIYVGAIVALFISANFLNWILLSLALAGFAIFLDRLDGK